MLFEAFKAFIVGLVEGITEWLPISSTGHMILVDEFLKLDVSDAFLGLFLVVIQIGAIMAVIILYFHKLNPFSPKKTAAERKSTWRLWGMVVVGCPPQWWASFWMTGLKSTCSTPTWCPPRLSFTASSSS